MYLPTLKKKNSTLSCSGSERAYLPSKCKWKSVGILSVQWLPSANLRGWYSSCHLRLWWQTRHSYRRRTHIFRYILRLLTLSYRFEILERQKEEENLHLRAMWLKMKRKARKRARHSNVRVEHKMAETMQRNWN